MIGFIDELRHRNEALFYFGLACFCCALFCVFMARFSTSQILGVNAWYKPVKFALSIGIFSWTMAWYVAYLELPGTIYWYNWGVIVLLGFELLYIVIQAGRGQLSHFNVSTPFYGFMYSMMAGAIAILTAWTGYIGLLFFRYDLPGLPDHYVWGIRIGIILFVIFAFEGFVMGARLTHTIGGPDGGPGLPFLNWSKRFGDPRIAHFVGMHALQAVPLLSYYVLKNTRLTLLLGILYGLVAVWLLVLALQAKPLFRGGGTAVQEKQTTT